MLGLVPILLMFGSLSELEVGSRSVHSPSVWKGRTVKSVPVTVYYDEPPTLASWVEAAAKV